jgi:hypothetical protein
MSWLEPDDEDEDEYDEADVRVRPNPKANRPRTKRRPAHADAQPARVLGVDRGRYTVLVGEDTPEEHEVTATRARELRKMPIVTGDRARVVGDRTGDQGTLARIIGIEERTTLLRRSADDTDQVERVIVANADQILIVVAAADPEPRARLVDRYLVAALDAGIRPLLVVTKTDLADPAVFLEHFEGLDLEVFRSARAEMPVDDIGKALAPPATSTRSRGADGTPRARPCRCATESPSAAAGWSTPPGSALSGSDTSIPTTSWMPSPTWRSSLRNAPAAARTCPTRPTARSSRPSPRGGSGPRARLDSTPSSVCSRRSLTTEI